MDTWSRCEWSRRGSSRQPAGMRAVGLALVMGLAAGCGAGADHPARSAPVPLPAPIGNSQQISRENLGYLWPLSVDHGTITCRAGDQAVFLAPDGKAYALNDTASAGGAADIELIRSMSADNSAISLGALRSRTLELCRH